MGIFEQYESYFLKYNAIYGDLIAILMQVGSFHELYGVDNETEKICNLSEIASILNIKETRNKSAILENSRTNPQLAGFNSVALDSNVDRLVSYGYTVVVVNQVGSTSEGNMTREVAYIKSPSTMIDMSAPRDPYMVSIWMKEHMNRSMCSRYDYIGMAAMDITTGKIYYYETNSSLCDPDLAMDNLKRFLQTFSPVEIIINGSTTKLNEATIESWGFRTSKSEERLKPTAYVNITNLPDIDKISFQEKILSDILKLEDPLVDLGLTKSTVAVHALIALLNFCQEHNSSLLKSLSLPILWGAHNNIILDNHSISQLGILESYYNQLKTESVYNLLSKWPVTSVGKRILRYRLLNGITDVTELRERYKQIGNMSVMISVKPNDIPGRIPITSSSTRTMHMYDYLCVGFKDIKDLDRMHHKLSLGTLTPSELYVLDINYKQILKVLKVINADANIMSILEGFTAIYRNVLNMEETGRCTVIDNMKDSIYTVGYNEAIDALAVKIRKCDIIREDLLRRLSDLVAVGSGCCKFKDGMNCVTLTKIQYAKLDRAFPEEGIKLDGGHVVMRQSLLVDTRNKTNIKIQITFLDVLIEDQDKYINELKELSIAEYKNLLSTLSMYPMNSFINHIGLLDLYQGMARMAEAYSYCCPCVEEDDVSYVKASGLRHPLVERNRNYVAHDIDIGGKMGGMLLYGVNQSGKSCTMKSIGIAIVMAQAGFYVPASNFVYSPYKNIMTRIIGNDSIDNGLSSYAVEMIELRSILTRADVNSLVLGDEVCHGTESSSAVSLVAASLMHLDRARASYIFATHLHELSRMPEIENIRQYHITVKFDMDGVIDYDRQIKPGSGTGLYGIEVAKHLRLPNDVLTEAFKIRNKYFSTATDVAVHVPVKSRYNSDIYISMCEIKSCCNRATCTHHIRYQSEAKDGLIDGYIDMNNAENLIGLCEEHHNHVHNGNGEGMQLIIFNRKKYEYRRMLRSLDMNIVV